MNNDFLKLEKTRDDFPFYNGVPKKVSAKDWTIMLIFTLLGFLFLALMPIPFLPKIAGMFIKAIALVLFPIVGMKLVLGKDWTLIFRKFHGRDIRTIVLYTILAILVATIFGMLLKAIGIDEATNPVAIDKNSKNALGLFALLRSQELIQLFGEEFLAILPFLALLQLFTAKFKLHRKKSVMLALLFSSIIFGLLHLPTYQWNWYQCILLIGTARIFLTLTYIKTKNIFVSYVTHYIYDTIIFALTFFLS